MRETINIIKSNNHWYKVFPDYSNKHIRISKKEAFDDINLAREKHDLFLAGDLDRAIDIWSYYN